MTIAKIVKASVLSAAMLVGCKEAPDASKTMTKSLSKQTSQIMDSISLSQKNIVKDTAPEIGAFRIISGFLSSDQIKQINKSKQLPDNCKFMKETKTIKTGENSTEEITTGDYEINYNMFNIRSGTQQLPEGFEVKRNMLFQAIVVPKGTKGLFIREVQ